MLAKACSQLSSWLDNCFTWSHLTGITVAQLPARRNTQHLPWPL